MKRDMDLIRSIVIAVRDSKEPIGGLPDVEDAVFAEHARLLQEAGLAEVRILKGLSATAAAILRLTWEGQNFADEINDPTVWEKAKEKVISPGASWTFGLLREVLKDIALTVIKQHI